MYFVCDDFVSGHFVVALWFSLYLLNASLVCCVLWLSWLVYILVEFWVRFGFLGLCTWFGYCSFVWGLWFDDISGGFDALILVAVFCLRFQGFAFGLI